MGAGFALAGMLALPAAAATAAGCEGGGYTVLGHTGPFDADIPAASVPGTIVVEGRYNRFALQGHHHHGVGPHRHRQRLPAEVRGARQRPGGDARERAGVRHRHPDALSPPKDTVVVQHCGHRSIWDVASGGRMGFVSGEDAVEVAPSPTICVHQCQAQNRVRGRAVVLGFPFPVPQDSRLNDPAP